MIPVFNQSPATYLLNILGKKWTYEILNSLMFEELHFSDILKRYPDMSGKMLSRRVKELFDMGLVGKTISNLQPLEFKYHTSDRGKLLRQVFYELNVSSTRMFRAEVLQNPSIDSEAIQQYFSDIYFPSGV
ncbi:MAG: winged helix-turn-helix transcriptional regulator [Candidatus Kariarchaeaceae archaeon]